jgi:hypothetical protein
MARRKKEPAEPSPIEATSERTRDRHKSRKTVSLPDDLYAELRALAQQNGRPTYWEIRMALRDHLSKHRRPKHP